MEPFLITISILGIIIALIDITISIEFPGNEKLRDAYSLIGMILQIPSATSLIVSDDREWYYYLFLLFYLLYTTKFTISLSKEEKKKKKKKKEKEEEKE